MDLKRARQILLQADVPGYFSPDGAAGRGLALRDRATQLRDRINARFDCTCRLDTTYQDASCHALIALPAEMLCGPDPLEARPCSFDSSRGLSPQIRMSNFGNLAVIVHEDRLKPGYAPLLQQLMEELGYVPVPEAAVGERYMGKLIAHSGRPVRDADPHATWFWRFFDYM
jgi:hypothetical protein